jgi:RNA polymerase primary sigma factor
MRQLKITQSITNRESQSLDKYLHEIGKVDLITAEEEVILSKKDQYLATKSVTS